MKYQPRGCEVTVYEDESRSGFSTTLHVPVKFPDPYFYYLKDFRYDQEGDSARGRDDKISAFLIMQDDSEDVYQNCGDTNNYHGYNYFFKKELFGNRWDIRDDDDNLIRFYNPEEWRSGFNKLEGTFSQHNYFNTADQDKEFETENFKNDSGLEIQNRIGNDDLTSFALTQGCKITLYESSADDDSSEIIEQAYPSFQNFDDVESQIFYPEFFGVMSDATLGYLENIPQADYGVEQGFCYDADGCPGYDQNFTQCSSGDCYCNCNDNYPNNDNYYDWYVDGNDDYSDMHGQNPNNAFWDYDYSGYTGSNYDGFKDRYLTHPINDSKKILNGDPINRKVQSFYSNHCSDLRDAVRDEMNAIWNSSEYFGSFDRKATYTEYEFLRDYGHYLGVDPDGDGDTLCRRDDNSGACTTFNAKYNELERECFTYNQRIKIVTSNLSDLQKSDFINFHYETVDDYGYSCLDYTVSQWKDIYYLQNLHKINEFDDGDPPWKFTREDDTKEVDEDGEVIKNNRGACAQRCDDNNYGDDIGDCKNDLMYELQKNGCWYSNFWYYTPWDVTKGSEDVTGVRFAQSWVENDEEFICPSYYYNVLYPGLYLTEQQEDDLAWNDNIESFSIVNDSNYDTINNWSQTYNTDSDFSPTFDEVEAAFIGRIAGLYFNGKSNFLESTDIADYIRDSSYYNSESGANDSTSESYDENSDDNGFSIFLSFTPYCDQRLTVENADGVEELVEDDGDTSNDCTEIANETENRVVFSTNWENYNTNTNDAYNIGDTISISPDGSLYYSNSADSNYLIADAADFEKSDGNDVQGFYNETAYIYFSRDKDDGVTIQYSVDSGSITTADDDRVATFASGITHNNDYITKFSIGQEWDYLNQPSQFFLGYLHEFAVLNTSTATNENGITKINTDVKDAYAKTVTSLRNTYDSNDEDADYTESTCSNAFNSDMIQMGYGDSFTDGVFEIHHESIDDDGDFNLPDDISTGDYFYFRIKDYKVQCSNTVNAAYEEYSNNSGSASVTLIVSKDASSLLPQLKTFIVDPIIDIFECDEDECVFYKLFYENVIGTPGGEETLFQILCCQMKSTRLYNYDLHLVL